MEEESDDVNFVSYVVIIIIIVLLYFLFRNQIYSFFVWVFNLIQGINQ